MKIHRNKKTHSGNRHFWSRFLNKHAINTWHMFWASDTVHWVQAQNDTLITDQVIMLNFQDRFKVMLWNKNRWLTSIWPNALSLLDKATAKARIQLLMSMKIIRNILQTAEAWEIIGQQANGSIGMDEDNKSFAMTIFSSRFEYYSLAHNIPCSGSTGRPKMLSWFSNFSNAKWSFIDIL